MASTAALIARIWATDDIYAILDVPRNATASDVKRAYRKLALKLHPDKCTEAGAEDAFARVSNAFTVLSDADKRRHYDRFGGEVNAAGAGSFAGGGPRGAHVSPEDLFAQFFRENPEFFQQQAGRGGGGGGGGRARGGGPGFRGFHFGGFPGGGGGGGAVDAAAAWQRNINRAPAAVRPLLRGMGWLASWAWQLFMATAPFSFMLLFMGVMLAGMWAIGWFLRVALFPWVILQLLPPNLRPSFWKVILVLVVADYFVF